MTVGDTNELDLTGWLEPGEPVLWHGQDSRTAVPWVALTLTLAVILGAYFFTVLTAVHRPPAVVVVALAALGTVIQVGGALTVHRARATARYVLTDRRAAVFRVPGELMSQTVVSSPFFHARCLRTIGRRKDAAAGGGRGTVDWGESDLQRRRRGVEAMRALSWTVGINNPDRVIFAGVPDFDVLVELATTTRRRWGAATPAPAAIGERSRPPEPLGFLDGRRAGRINGAVLVLATACFTLATVMCARTFAPHAGAFGPTLTRALYLLMIVLFVWMMGTMVGRRQRPGQKMFAPIEESKWGRAHTKLYTYVPKFALVVLIGVFAASWAAGVLDVASLPYKVAYDATTHRYTEDDHGRQRDIALSTYRHLLTEENRVYLTGVVAFSAISATLCLDEMGRRRRRTDPATLVFPQAEGAWTAPVVPQDVAR